MADATLQDCRVCKGTGRDPMSDNVNWLPCTQCRGSGKARAMADDRLHPGRYQVGTRIYTVRASGHIICDGHEAASARYWDGTLYCWRTADRAPLETIIADPLGCIIEAGDV